MPIVAPTPAPNIPTPVPTTADPATFDARADATLSALPPSIAGVNAIGANVYANAQEVVTQANIATSKAQIATDKAQAASDSQGVATNKAQAASDSAATANTRAGEANISAQNADTARQLAQDWASKATGTVGTSGLKSALQYAADAATLGGNLLVATSATSQSVALGSQTFTIQANKAFGLGQIINRARTSNPAVVMTGPLTAYDPVTGIATQNVTDATGIGTGPFTDWTISVAGLKGAAASQPITQVSGTTQTAVAGVHYVMNNAALSTVALPASPSPGDALSVTFTNGRTDNQINTGGKVRGVTQDITADLPITFSMKFISAAYGWEIL